MHDENSLTDPLAGTTGRVPVMAGQDRSHDVPERDTDAKSVGLPEAVAPSLEALERRRIQVWAVFIVVLVGFSAALVLLSYWENMLPPSVRDFASLDVLRVLFIAVIAAFAIYVFEKERNLRSMTRTLIDERVMNAALQNRVTELANLAKIGRAVNSELDTHNALALIMASALDMLGASEGAIMLVEPDRGILQAVTSQPEGICRERIAPEVVIGEGIPGWVARNSEALLVSAEHDSDLFTRLVSPGSGIFSSMCVPLLHRDEVLGVLLVNETAGVRHFSEYDLRALGLFAENAATAIANARLFEAERAHVAKLREIDRQRSEFVANVSHELRAPLTSIIGSARTLERKGRELPDEHYEEFIAVITRQSDRLMRLISDILFASKIEAGQSNLRNEEISVPEVVGEVVSAIRARDPLGRLVLSCISPDVQVFADPSAIHQVLTNLIDNAFKYAPADTMVTLTVAESGDDIAMTVADEGPGIPTDKLPSVFERFRQVGETQQAAAAPGVGLGLYICANLVSSMGGRIWVQSAEGRGSAFTFTLPILRTGSSRDVESAGVTSKTKASVATDAEGAGTSAESAG